MAFPQTKFKAAGGLWKPFLLIGLPLMILCLSMLIVNRPQALRSYLFSFIFWTGLPLGSLGLLMVHHLTGGAWGYAVRRHLEAGIKTLPLMAAFFLPLALGLPSLYEWADPFAVAKDEHLAHLSRYLNLPFFLTRSLLYFAVWTVFVVMLCRWSNEQDEREDPELNRKLKTASAPGLILYVFTATFAFTDWTMSLEPRWSSSIYGLMVLVGHLLTALSWAVLSTASKTIETPVGLRERSIPPKRPDDSLSRFASLFGPGPFNDLGNLLLTFVMLWAYLSFSQWLIIWSGNLSEEAAWYLKRTRGGWQGLALVLIVFQFAIPFLLLLSRNVKRRPKGLAGVAALILAARVLDVYWLIAPAFSPTRFRVHWLDLAAFIGMGGLWIGCFLLFLSRRPLVPAHDVRLKELPV